MPKNHLPPITPQEQQDAARPAPRSKAKARSFQWKGSMPMVEMMVIVGLGMILMLA